MHRLRDLHMSEQGVFYEIPFLRSSELSSQCLFDLNLERIEYVYAFDLDIHSCRADSNL